MELGEYIRAVADNYDRLAGLQTPTQALLKGATEQLAEHVPPDFVVKGSGGKGKPTDTPWFGIFDPDETTSPQRGLYVVYIFAADLTSVALTLNQGMEVLRKELGNRGARERLAGDAQAIVAAIDSPILEQFSDDIDLGSTGSRQRAYTAGNLACKMYSTSDLPQEERLASELTDVLNLYELAVEAKRYLLLAEPGSVASPVGTTESSTADPLSGFKPKSDAEYRAHLTGRELVKSRRHETLVNRFADWASGLGFRVSSPHPEDLLLSTDEVEMVIEAKVVYQGDATAATRAAVGQLLMYRHLLHSGSTPRLVGLFSEDIGVVYSRFLETLQIASVWWDRGTWIGSSSAVELGLADPAPDGRT